MFVQNQVSLGFVRLFYWCIVYTIIWILKIFYLEFSGLFYCSVINVHFASKPYIYWLCKLFGWLTLFASARYILSRPHQLVKHFFVLFWSFLNLIVTELLLFSFTIYSKLFKIICCNFNMFSQQQMIYYHLIVALSTTLSNFFHPFFKFFSSFGNSSGYYTKILLFSRINKDVIISSLPPQYWQQEGGVSCEFTYILFNLRCGKCICLLHLQMVRRWWIVGN